MSDRVRKKAQKKENSPLINNNEPKTNEEKINQEVNQNIKKETSQELNRDLDKSLDKNLDDKLNLSSNKLKPRPKLNESQIKKETSKDIEEIQIDKKLINEENREIHNNQESSIMPFKPRPKINESNSAFNDNLDNQQEINQISYQEHYNDDIIENIDKRFGKLPENFNFFIIHYLIIGLIYSLALLKEGHIAFLIGTIVVVISLIFLRGKIVPNFIDKNENKNVSFNHPYIILQFTFQILLGLIALYSGYLLFSISGAIIFLIFSSFAFEYINKYLRFLLPLTILLGLTGFLISLVLILILLFTNNKIFNFNLPIFKDNLLYDLENKYNAKILIFPVWYEYWPSPEKLNSNTFYLKQGSYENLEVDEINNLLKFQDTYLLNNWGNKENILNLVSAGLITLALTISSQGLSITLIIFILILLSFVLRKRFYNIDKSLNNLDKNYLNSLESIYIKEKEGLILYDSSIIVNGFFGKNPLLTSRIKKLSSDNDLENNNNKNKSDLENNIKDEDTFIFE